jgi:hypothetical protein
MSSECGITCIAQHGRLAKALRDEFRVRFGVRLRFRLVRVDERNAIHLVTVAELRPQGQRHQIEAVAAFVGADFEIRIVGGELRL